MNTIKKVLIRFFKAKTITRRLSRIKLLILDVDGVLTDGGLCYSPQGEVMRVFDVSDGLGIKLVQKNGVNVAFLSGGDIGSIGARAFDLGVRWCWCKKADKGTFLSSVLPDFGYEKEEIAFVGDDLNDLSVIGEVGLFIAPANSVRFVKKNADYVLTSKGGRGAVREVTDLIVKYKMRTKVSRNEKVLMRNT